MAWLKVDGLLAALFPRRCILCDQPAGLLNCCAGCRQDLPWITSPCARCGEVLPTGYAGKVCGRCDALTAAIDRIVSALVYEYPVDRLIAMAKFQGRVDSANALGELLAVYLLGGLSTGELTLPDLILPVPLHPRRMAQRGFNQAAEIARPLARSLCIPIQSQACRRIRNTAEQTRIDAADRPKNTRDAFRALDNVAGKNIAVVDDVLTTGSTGQSVAIALRNAGAGQIQIWTVARTVNPAIGRQRLLPASLE